MAAKRKRRVRRKKNPTPLEWGLILGVPVVLGVGGYFGVQALRERRRQQALADLPKPPIPQPFPTEPSGPEGAPAPGQCGPEYPGFAYDGDGCVPTEDTPAGIYVGENCTDFVFVPGGSGPQIDALEALVLDEAIATQDPTAPSADPAVLASSFLSEFWPECSWEPDGPPRISNMFQAVAYIIGREIIAANGRVLGTSDGDLVDELIAERLAEAGFGPFDASVVPEIDLPEVAEEAQGLEAFPA